MKRVVLLLVAALLLVVVIAPAASAHPTTCDSGRQYGLSHIVPLAHEGALGQGHKPGSHHGFAGLKPGGFASDVEACNSHYEPPGHHD